MSGADRATFLQGLLTNDVAALGSGAGCYAAYLTPQGRMIADVFAYELGDRMLLVVPGAVKDALLTKLDRLIFTEDVQLGDLTDTFDQIALVGPNAAAVAAAVLENAPRTRLDALPEHGNLQARFIGQPVIVTPPHGRKSEPTNRTTARTGGTMSDAFWCVARNCAMRA